MTTPNVTITTSPGPHWRETALARLDTLASECAKERWDGDDAHPVPPETVDRTRRLLLALPAWCPEPALHATWVGELTLSWQRASAPDIAIVIDENEVEYRWGVMDEDDFEGSHGYTRMRDDLPLPILGILAAAFNLDGVRAHMTAANPSSATAIAPLANVTIR